jgi:hypothetical protein
MLWATPSGDQSKGATPLRNWSKTVAKIHHAEKTLQSLDVLGEGQDSILAA